MKRSNYLKELFTCGALDKQPGSLVKKSKCKTLNKIPNFPLEAHLSCTCRSSHVINGSRGNLNHSRSWSCLIKCRQQTSPGWPFVCVKTGDHLGFLGFMRNTKATLPQLDTTPLAELLQRGLQLEPHLLTSLIYFGYVLQQLFVLLAVLPIRLPGLGKGGAATSTVALPRSLK